MTKHTFNTLFFGALKRYNFPILIVVVITSLAFYTSCANVGSPEGGLKDTIAPEVVKSVPLANSTNFSGTQVSITFNEYVTADNINDKLMISPPLFKRPTFTTKGKTFIIKFNEDLIPDRTYSIDFKDAIKDYNEGNPLPNYRFLFSNYAKIDTLQVSGIVLDAFTLEPVKDALVLFYTLVNDTIFTKMRPDYIAKTDEKGIFLADNLPSGSYSVFGLVDGDNNLVYSQDIEQIAFLDSLVYPRAEFSSIADTLIVNGDTTISHGHTVFTPNNIELMLFTDKQFNQFLITSRREARDKMSLIFNEPIDDSFKISQLNLPSSNWFYSELSERRDTIKLWITDTLVSNIDSLKIKIDYRGVDSLKKSIILTDTLEMNFVTEESRFIKKQKNSQAEIPGIALQTNIKPTDFDLNEAIKITSPIPIALIDTSRIKLVELENDSVFNIIEWQLKPDSVSKRIFWVNYKPKEKVSYRLTIDSAAMNSLSGLASEKLKVDFKTQKMEFYGTIKLTIEGFDDNGIIYLLKTDKTETVERVQKLMPNQKEIVFNFLKPDKYIIKVVDDQNNNGKWDGGNYASKRQPEAVYYFPQVIKVKSNWDYKENWKILNRKTKLKSIIDNDAPKKQ